MLRILSPLLLLPLALLLTGCTAIQTTATAGSVIGPAIRGNVHGGQQSIAGAHIYLFAANSSGYPTASTNASVSLLTASTGNPPDTSSNYYVVSGADGSFSITGDYTCTSGQQVYLYSSGGNSSSGNNSAIGLMAILGACPSDGNFLSGASPIPFVNINEVTTVAAAYAFAGFSYDATHVGSPSADTANHPQALTGIRNAFATASNIANIATGTAYSVTPGGNGTVPQQQINTLANILAACINTDSSGSSQCSILLSNALSSGATGNQPSDTATAAIYIAQHPYVSAAVLTNLFSLQAGVAAPFTPNLSSAPSSFVMLLTFAPVSPGSLFSVGQIAVDSQGNIWISGAGPFLKFNNLGVEASGSPFSNSNLNNLNGIAIDAGDNLWVVNSGATTSQSGLVQFSNAGIFQAAVPPSPSISNPYVVAIDASGNLWLPSPTTGSSGNLTKISSNGSILNNYTGNGMTTGSQGIAINSSGQIWVSHPNVRQGSLSAFNADGSAVSGSPYTVGGDGGVTLPAFDPSGNLWSENPSGIDETFAGVPVSGSPFGTSSNFSPNALAVDSSNSVWALGVTFQSLTPPQPHTVQIFTFSNTGSLLSPSSGFLLASLTRTTAVSGLAIDSSGNVWTAGAYPSSQSRLYELVGAAAPVITPTVANLISPYSHPASRP